MWTGLAPAHEVNIGHVPLTPAAPPDAVHIRPDAETILVVLAFVIVAMYRRHYPASSPFLFFRAHESPGTISRRGFRVCMHRRLSNALVLRSFRDFPETLRYYHSTSGACKLILFVTRTAPELINKLSTVRQREQSAAGGRLLDRRCTARGRGGRGCLSYVCPGMSIRAHHRCRTTSRR